MDELMRTLTCPISQALIADPVLLPDGYTYSREHVEAWVEVQHRERRIPAHLVRCPMNPGNTIGHLSKLLPNRAVGDLVTLAVKLNPGHELALDYASRKRKRDDAEAEKLWKDGRIHEAAAQGHKAAIEAVRVRQMETDAAALVEQAKAKFRANPDDLNYRRLLRQAAVLESQEALFMLGTAYAEGQGGPAKPEKALEYFMKTKAARTHA